MKLILVASLLLYSLAWEVICAAPERDARAPPASTAATKSTKRPKWEQSKPLNQKPLDLEFNSFASLFKQVRPYTPNKDGRQLDKVTMVYESHVSGEWRDVKGQFLPTPHSETFPGYLQTSFIPIDLDEGDLLYVPKGWSTWLWSENALLLNFYSENSPHNFPGSESGLEPSHIRKAGWKTASKKFWMISEAVNHPDKLDPTFRERISGLFFGQNNTLASLPLFQEKGEVRMACCADSTQLLPEVCVQHLAGKKLTKFASTVEASKRTWMGLGVESFQDVSNRLKRESGANCLLWANIPSVHEVIQEGFYALPYWLTPLRDEDLRQSLQYTAGQADSGLHLNTYFSTIYSLRGKSKILIFPPKDAAKLYFGNPKRVVKQLRKWKLIKKDSEQQELEEQELENIQDEQEEEEEVDEMQVEIETTKSKKKDECKTKACKAEKIWSKKKKPQEEEVEEEKPEEPEKFEEPVIEETAEQKYKRLREDDKRASEANEKRMRRMEVLRKMDQPEYFASDPIGSIFTYKHEDMVEKKQVAIDFLKDMEEEMLEKQRREREEEVEL